MRIEGRVENGNYVITGPQGKMKEIPLAEAREDSKLAAAIKRNGWAPIPEE